MLVLLTPHLRVDSVLDLDVERIRGLGLEALLLDVDCTLKRYCDEACTLEVVEWINKIRRAGIGLCLVSNGQPRRIRQFAAAIDLPFAAVALKPTPFRIRAAIRRMGFAPARTAMVGDQVFADVLAGRLAGLYTILVRPIHPEEEPWFAQLKRGPERAWLRWLDAKNAPRDPR